MNFGDFLAGVGEFAAGAAGAVEQFGRNEIVPGVIRAAMAVDEFGRNEVIPGAVRAAIAVDEFGRNEAGPAL